jgi:hypothetical protein
MPQITIYLDTGSSLLIEQAAKRASLSLSRWARQKLLLAAGSPSWPEDYSSVLGSISDPTFQAPREADQSVDQMADLTS